MAQTQEPIALPEPRFSGGKSLESLLRQRRSVREFQQASLSPSELGQLLWAAQGITHAQGLRSAPSAGALYPLELYVVAGNVDGLKQGVYHYMPAKHRLDNTAISDRRGALSLAAHQQSWIKNAAVVVVIAAVFKRTTRKYGKRGIRYVHIEAGHAAQNLFLQAEALGLATVVVGAFDDSDVAKLLHLPGNMEPLLLMPVGFNDNN